MKYAQELAAWKAGHSTGRSLAKALGIGVSTAGKRIAQMRKAGLLPEREASALAHCVG